MSPAGVSGINPVSTRLDPRVTAHDHPTWLPPWLGPGLGGGLHLLLVRPDRGQRGVVGDVADGVARASLAVVAGRLAPAGRADAKLLAQQRHRDLRLVGAEARQLG